MSTEQQGQGQTTQQANTSTAASEVANFFGMAGVVQDQPRLRYVTGTCQFNVEGAGHWRVEINEGKLKVSKTPPIAPPADAVINMSAETMARILRRDNNLNAFAALLQEAMDVSGDPTFAASLLLGITFDQADMHPA
jgi:hypothetical protein